MKDSANLLLGVVAAGLVAAAVFLLYRWRQRQRVRRVETWVNAYLAARYGGLPSLVHINCSDDTSWPVLVEFETPRTGSRHRLQFTCGGPQSTFALLSAQEERR